MFRMFFTTLGFQNHKIFSPNIMKRLKINLSTELCMVFNLMVFWSAFFFVVVVLLFSQLFLLGENNLYYYVYF